MKRSFSRARFLMCNSWPSVGGAALGLIVILAEFIPAQAELTVDSQHIALSAVAQLSGANPEPSNDREQNDKDQQTVGDQSLAVRAQGIGGSNTVSSEAAFSVRQTQDKASVRWEAQARIVVDDQIGVQPQLGSSMTYSA